MARRGHLDDEKTPSAQERKQQRGWWWEEDTWVMRKPVFQAMGGWWQKKGVSDKKITPS
jgi:hypothetical protein